jgi:hypothetical protein
MTKGPRQRPFFNARKGKEMELSVAIVRPIEPISGVAMQAEFMVLLDSESQIQELEKRLQTHGKYYIDEIHQGMDLREFTEAFL